MEHELVWSPQRCSCRTMYLACPTLVRRILHSKIPLLVVVYIVLIVVIIVHFKICLLESTQHRGGGFETQVQLSLAQSQHPCLIRCADVTACGELGNPGWQFLQEGVFEQSSTGTPHSETCILKTRTSYTHLSATARTEDRRKQHKCRHLVRPAARQWQGARGLCRALRTQAANRPHAARPQVKCRTRMLACKRKHR